MSNTPPHILARARRTAVSSVLAGALVALTAAAASASPLFWKFEWPATDFSKKSVEYSEIISGGPPKDGIPSIDNPKFEPAKNVRGLKDTVPVISFAMNGEAKAYPLGILMRHEIVNDKVGGIPVAVTYCPLCNSAIVFDARVDGRVLEFGTTGKLRNSDLVMYDRTTESWWQQFLGEAIIGELTGTQLKMLPSRIESFAKFRARFPEGTVLKPIIPFGGRGGGNPYVGYDTAARPFLYRGPLPSGIPAMARVIAVGDQAWTMELLRKKKRIEADDIVMTWETGQNSALDSRDISRGRDVGNVVVQRKTANGMVDIVHDITFAFVFHAFRPEGTIHKS